MVKGRYTFQGHEKGFNFQKQNNTNYPCKYSIRMTSQIVEHMTILKFVNKFQHFITQLLIISAMNIQSLPMN